MTTVGYGDITPFTEAEKVYAILMMVFGATLFAYVLANVATITETLRGPDAKILERVNYVTEYLVEKNASPAWVLVVKQHFKFALSERSSFDENNLMERLPMSMAQDIL